MSGSLFISLDKKLLENLRPQFCGNIFGLSFFFRKKRKKKESAPYIIKLFDQRNKKPHTVGIFIANSTLGDAYRPWLEDAQKLCEA